MDSVVHPFAETKLRIALAVFAGVLFAGGVRTALLWADVPPAIATGPVVTAVSFVAGIAVLVAAYVLLARRR